MYAIRLHPNRFQLFVLLVAVTFAGCAPKLQRAEYTRVVMGVEARIILYAPDEAAAEHAARAAFARLAELDAVMSDYRADSELMQLCRSPAGKPVRVSDDLFRVISTAQRVAHASGGAFDITAGPLVRLWREARDAHKLPSTDAVAQAQQRVDYHDISLDSDAQTIALRGPGMRLDLGGIGKGYAAQEAIRTLRDHNVTSALVALAGDIVVSNAPPEEEGWRITIDHSNRESDRAPHSDEVANNSPALEGGGRGVGGAHGVAQCARETGDACTLTLTNAAISTSGSNQQFITINGTRYSHIIDPRTGLGLTTQTIVTVIARNNRSNYGALADALSSAACILGREEGAALVAQFPNCTAVFSVDPAR